MIRLIKKILLESQFTIEENINYKQKYEGFFSKRLANEKFDFLLVMSIKEEDLYLKDLEDFIKEYFEQILQQQEYPGVDKNSSMLLLTERNTIIFTEEFNKIIYEFEENPYYFKKYLLPYTSEQYKLLRNNINFNEGVLKQLESIVSNKLWFSSLKDQEKGIETIEAKTFDVVSKIYIKLPFLKVPIYKRKLSNIVEEIKTDISTEDYEIVDKILNIENKDPKWEDILFALGVELDEL